MQRKRFAGSYVYEQKKLLKEHPLGRCTKIKKNGERCLLNAKVRFGEELYCINHWTAHVRVRDNSS